MPEPTDRERALEMVCAATRSLGDWRNRMVNAMLEFAAQEVEKIKADCTCDPVWDPCDPTCTAHDLEAEVKVRAAELRRQKERADG